MQEAQTPSRILIQINQDTKSDWRTYSLSKNILKPPQSGTHIVRPFTFSVHERQVNLFFDYCEKAEAISEVVFGYSRLDVRIIPAFWWGEVEPALLKELIRRFQDPELVKIFKIGSDDPKEPLERAQIIERPPVLSLVEKKG